MTLYVSPQGNDAHPGTESQPLKSLPGARDAVRQVSVSDKEDIRVLFREGTYPIDSTVVFGLADSSPDYRRISYEAYPGEEPVFSGGVPLGGWQNLSESGETVPEQLPEEAGNHVWITKLPARPNASRAWSSLFSGEQRIPRSRGKSFAFEPAEDIPKDSSWFTARVPDGILLNQSDIKNAELVVIPHFTWTMNILPVKSFDADTRVLQTTVPCTYPLFPSRRSETAWLENTLSALKSPGSWAADYENDTIYYWPASGVPEEDLVLPALTELLRVEGTTDYEGKTDTPVKNLTFSGITFSQGARFPFNGQTGWGMQHDWEMFNRATAMVRMRGAEGCVVQGCTFSSSDGAGIRLDLHCRDNSIIDSTFEHLGGCGIVLCGYGPGTKDVNTSNTVENNHVHHIGRINWHSPGIFVWQSGYNRIAGNHIHNTPYTGIVVSGRIRINRKDQDLRGIQRPGFSECFNTIRWSDVASILGPDYEMPAWHQAWKDDWDKRKPLLHCRNNIIEYNDIHDVMEIMGDGNGIYISGTGSGNRAQFNRVHDCPSSSMGEGIRCDDDQHETFVHGNLIYRIGGMGTGITIKGVNTITNNIVACPLVSKTARGLISLEVGPLHGSVIRRNILYATNRSQSFYYQKRLSVHGTGPDPLLRDCDADENLYWCTDDPSRCDDLLVEERSFGVEGTSMTGNPMFEDAEAGDFELRADSPAWKLGFVAIAKRSMQ